MVRRRRSCIITGALCPGVLHEIRTEVPHGTLNPFHGLPDDMNTFCFRVSLREIGGVFWAPVLQVLLFPHIGVTHFEKGALLFVFFVYRALVN
jgi:hypothetical protein